MSKNDDIDWGEKQDDQIQNEINDIMETENSTQKSASFMDAIRKMARGNYSKCARQVCKNEGCERPRQQGSSRCEKCSYKHSRKQDDLS
jgi:hypothetical protein